jgi:hypothetical protein
MDRLSKRDQQPEGPAKQAVNAKKASPPPWEMGKYIYQESSTDDGRPSHSDPRLELALQSHDLHQERFDSDFIPSDDDSEYGPPVFGLGATPDLYASASSASEWGSLAGDKGQTGLSVQRPKMGQWFLGTRDRRQSDRRQMRERARERARERVRMRSQARHQQH